MSGPSTPIMISSDDEIAPESPLFIPPRSPKFMPISADRTAEIECSEEFYSSGDEPETVEEKSEPPEAKSQPTAILHIPAEIGNEITALRLRMKQDEQRIAELEQQMAITKDTKRKWEDNPEGSSGQQKGKTRKTVEADNGTRYRGKRPLCTRCNQHHTGRCGPQCGKCGRFGHSTKDCRIKTPANAQAVDNQTQNNPSNQRTPRACYECGGVGHLKNQCGNLKNRNKNKKNSTRGTNE